mmetsp:Transcript_6180/g.17104  ORF Transcript_6180/g.17104 Transcript_6180/m.17104 type:complete len:276 (-) Transcript_6180:36-863(-)
MTNHVCTMNRRTRRQHIFLGRQELRPAAAQVRVPWGMPVCPPQTLGLEFERLEFHFQSLVLAHHLVHHGLLGPRSGHVPFELSLLARDPSTGVVQLSCLVRLSGPQQRKLFILAEDLRPELPKLCNHIPHPLLDTANRMLWVWKLCAIVDLACQQRFEALDNARLLMAGSSIESAYPEAPVAPMRAEDLQFIDHALGKQMSAQVFNLHGLAVERTPSCRPQRLLEASPAQDAMARIAMAGHGVVENLTAYGAQQVLRDSSTVHKRCIFQTHGGGW